MTYQSVITGHQYVIDQQQGNCSIDRIPSNGLDITHPHGDLDWVAMRHGRDMFNLADQSFYYQGQVQARGILMLRQINLLDSDPVHYDQE